MGGGTSVEQKADGKLNMAGKGNKLEGLKSGRKFLVEDGETGARNRSAN